MKCQILFSRKNKKNITNLSSAESANSVVCVNPDYIYTGNLENTYWLLYLNSHFSSIDILIFRLEIKCTVFTLNIRTDRPEQTM